MSRKKTSFSASETDLKAKSKPERIGWFCDRYQEWIIKQVKSTIDRKKKRNDFFPFLVTVCSAIDSLGAYYCGIKSGNRERFLEFIRVYLHRDWQTRTENERHSEALPYLNTPIKHLPREIKEKWWYIKQSEVTYAERFYRNFRCGLLHSMLIIDDAIDNAQKEYFSCNKRRKYRLCIKTDALKEDFVQGVENYLQDLKRSSAGDTIWDNFHEVFEHLFIRTP